MYLTAITVNAGVSFYFTTKGFAVATAAMTLRGTEDWSSAGNAPATSLSDPLSPGVANGPFANGSSVAAGVQVQSNFLGNTPTNTAPGDGLYYAPAGYIGNSGNVQPSDQVSANRPNDGFDMIFQTIGLSVPRAVSFSPMYYQLGSTGEGSSPGDTSAADLTIRVYNQSGAFLGSATVTNVQDCLEDAFLGIVTTGSDTLGRVNVWATSTDTSGADNIAVYADAEITPTLHALGFASGNFSFELDGRAGRQYAILSTGDFASWIYEQTNQLSSNSMQLTLVATNALRFYRAQSLP